MEKLTLMAQHDGFIKQASDDDVVVTYTVRERRSCV